ncbi:Uncharacterised protein [Burkholderia pseudomallei]|nr:Uncharacterised protein [Burkholderia pseudomallei]
MYSRARTRAARGSSRAAFAVARPGRGELERFADWRDGRPQTELNFKRYRQATNKIVGISNEAAAFLDTFLR